MTRNHWSILPDHGVTFDNKLTPSVIQEIESAWAHCYPAVRLNNSQRTVDCNAVGAHIPNALLSRLHLGHTFFVNSCSLCATSLSYLQNFSAT